MKDTDGFERLKRKKARENEEAFGEEIREKYGEEAVEKSNKKFLNLSQEDLAAMNRLEEELIQLLIELSDTGDILGEKGHMAYLKHKKWLSFTWPSYDPKAYVGLAQTYVEDERFARYYREKAGMDVAEVLRDAITAHAK